MLVTPPEIPCDQAFRRKVLDACFAALESAGFARYRKNGVERDLGKGFRCWLGLNASLHATRVEVNPFVGLHVVPIEKLWTRLKTGRYPGKYDRGVATMAVHLGLLCPDERAFRFSCGSDIEVEAGRLASLYGSVGLLYASENCSYEALLPLLKERIELLGGFPERYACCLYLMGHESEAREFATRFCASHRDYFEGFAVPFVNFIDKKST